jgi:hypothetical protein
MGILVVAALFAVAFYGQQLGINNTPNWFVINGPRSSWAQETITGSGTQGEETRQVGNFDRVRLEGIGKLFIEQGDETELAILADDNLLPHITSEVRGGELTIGIESGYALQPKQNIEYRLTVVDLSAVYLDGAGDIMVKTLDTKSLKVAVSGTGGITLEALQAQSLDVQINGSGWVNAAGQAREVETTINGAGSLEAGNLECEVAEFNISGLGKVTAWVTEKLSARISGAGNIAYYGDPDVEKRIDGVGNIQSLGDK